ncbi:MAG: O-antigen ligase family protein [Opitutaceae bacterium]|nr:O-antigen ligase family protein [Opitutaceae bacterium]
MQQLILLGFLLFALWLIRRDIAMRPGLSVAIWIPTLWVGIIASRPLSAWIGSGGASDTLDGSPVDRMFYLTMIVAAVITLSRRAFSLQWVMARSWPIVLFYAFLLLSVLWANSLEASFKRWFKETGNILVALVILTESNPMQAIRAVFVRCALVLIPLSLIFIRYFPDLGRRYSQHSGQMEATGVTFQKNSLGTMLLVCCIVFIWDWMERTRAGEKGWTVVDRAVALAVMAISVWLFFLCDSKTSMVTVAVATILLAAIRLPKFHRRVSAFGIYTVAAVIALLTMDNLVGVTEMIVRALGRDMTFTGRTEVWRELFAVGTDPLFGTGFMSFWDDRFYQDKLPNWVAFSAHNGYVEIYLAGGMIGVGFLGLMLLGVAFIIKADLKRGGSYAVVRFAVFVAVLIANFFESNFACMTPLGFLFLLVAIGYATPRDEALAAAPSEPDDLALQRVAPHVTPTPVAGAPHFP